MDKLHKNIVSYLEKNLGNKKPFIYKTDIVDNESSEVWGYNAIKILVLQTDSKIFYKMMPSK